MEASKKRTPYFWSYFLKNINEILFVTSILAMALYIIMSTLVLYAKCNNLGWRRLFIIAAFIPGLAVAFHIYIEAGYKISGEEYFQIFLGAMAGYISAIFVILGGRETILWIREGFSQPS